MQELTVIIITAVSIGLFHTMLGPDHYLPFIVMAKVRNWSLARATCITVLCDIGHVSSSVVLGIIGIVLERALINWELSNHSVEELHHGC